MLLSVESTSSAWHMSLFLIWSMCWTFELIVKQYAYSCKCVVKKLHSWFLINRVMSKVFPDFFYTFTLFVSFRYPASKKRQLHRFPMLFPNHPMQKSAEPAVVFLWTNGAPERYTFSTRESPVKSQEINSDLEAFLWTFQRKFLGAGFFWEWPGWWLWKVLHPQRKLQPFCSSLLLEEIRWSAPVDR